MNDWAEGTVRIRNRQFKRVKVRICAESGLVGPDGKDVDAELEVVPGEIELGPWQTRNVKVRASITTEMKKGVDYKADINAYAHHQHAELTVRRV